MYNVMNATQNALKNYYYNFLIVIQLIVLKICFD